MTGEPIDWAAAVRSGRRFAPTGPSITPVDAALAVADLREYSRSAELAVRDVTGLGRDLPVADAVVVDRPGWIAASVEGMAVLSRPLVDKLTDKLGQPKAARSVAGAQLGMVLGYLSGRVLGQFDPMIDGPSGAGRLLLVAPNVVKVEREIHAKPADFRMWVCLHEGTHRLQFTAVGWMREYFRSLVAEFAEVSDLDAAEMIKRLAEAVRPGSGRRPGGSERSSWIEAVQTPAQREVFNRLIALMTLLEGHADHVMDAVGPSVVPTVAAIRASFSDRRRRGTGVTDRLIRALLGMDMKLAQYVKGEAFVSAVVTKAGMAAFNTVWESPANLPSRGEIAEPATWIHRVL